MINKENLNLYYIKDWELNSILETKNFLENINNNNNVTEIILNISFSSAVNIKKKLLIPLLGLEILTCQKCQITKTKKSIANFNIRENIGIGCKINLHNLNKKVFLFKLFNVLLPNTKNLYNLLESYKTEKNYSLGMNNIIIFTEFIDVYLYLHLLKGMDIIIKQKSNKKVFLSLPLPRKKSSDSSVG